MSEQRSPMTLAQAFTGVDPAAAQRRLDAMNEARVDRVKAWTSLLFVLTCLALFAAAPLVVLAWRAAL